MRVWLLPIVTTTAMTAIALVVAGGSAQADDTAPAKQESAHARLVYTTTVDTGGVCPDESSVKRLVGARLGYDPFVSESDRVVTLRIKKRGGELVGHLEISDGSSASAPGIRDLSSSSCDELVSTLAVTIAVGIDPLSITGPRSPPATAATPTPTSEGNITSAEEKPLPSAKKDSFPRLNLQAGSLVAIGATPTVALGVTVGGSARWPSFSLGAEGRLDFPLSNKTAADGGEISASLLLGTIVPCYCVGIFRVCVPASVGVLRGSGESVSVPKQTTRPWAAVGGRAGIEVPVARGFAVGAHMDVYATLTRITLELDDHEVWSSPAASGAAGFDAIGTF